MSEPRWWFLTLLVVSGCVDQAPAVSSNEQEFGAGTNQMLHLLDGAEQAKQGNLNAARAKLESLRHHLDGWHGERPE